MRHSNEWPSRTEDEHGRIMGMRNACRQHINSVIGPNSGDIPFVRSSVWPSAGSAAVGTAQVDRLVRKSRLWLLPSFQFLDRCEFCLPRYPHSVRTSGDSCHSGSINCRPSSRRPISSCAFASATSPIENVTIKRYRNGVRKSMLRQCRRMFCYDCRVSLRRSNLYGKTTSELS